MSTKTKLSAKRTTPVSRAPKPGKKAQRKAAPVSKALRRYQVTAPRVSATGTRMSITHREFVQDIQMTVGFAAGTLPINPARDVCFTWLADIASRYERYQFQKLHFCYEPRCSTITAGSVILAVDFDAQDAAPVTKQEAYSYSQTAQSSAWDECCLAIDPSILNNRGTLFCRPGAVPTGTDPKTYDLGNLLLCTSGGIVGIVGELFVEYTLILSIPQLQSNVQSGSYINAVGVSTAVPFGTGPLALTGLLDATLTSTFFTFLQNWKGILVLTATGTGLATCTITGTVVETVLSSVVNAGLTSQTIVYTLDALRGQYFGPVVTATTWTSAQWRFTPTS